MLYTVKEIGPFMQSMLLFGPDSKQQHTYIDSFCEKEGIGKFDRQIFTTEESSFGIQDVREMQKKAMQKPSRGDKKTLILHHAELLTMDAQNALLKLLEEPPHGTTIFLCATSLSAFLPTVLSRCKVVSIGEKERLSDEKRVQFLEMISTIQQGTTGDRLVLAETLANKKEELAQTLLGILEAGRERLLENPHDIQVAKLLYEVQKTYQLSQTTNVSQRLLLEHCFLSV